MLVLTRKPGERIILGTKGQVEVVSVDRGVVKFALFVDQPVILMPGDVRIEVGGDSGSGSPIRVTRKVDDSVLIGDLGDIEVLVVSVKGEAVRIGVKAPQDVPVWRKEKWDEIRRQNIAAAQTASVDAERLQRLLRTQKKQGEAGNSDNPAETPEHLEDFDG